MRVVLTEKAAEVGMRLTYKWVAQAAKKTAKEMKPEPNTKKIKL